MNLQSTIFVLAFMMILATFLPSTITSAHGIRRSTKLMLRRLETDDSDQVLPHCHRSEPCSFGSAKRNGYTFVPSWCKCRDDQFCGYYEEDRITHLQHYRCFTISSEDNY